MKLENFEQVEKCPVCDCKALRKLYAIQYFNDTILPRIGVDPPYPEASIQQCTKCQHCFCTPQLSDRALDLYYTKNNTEYYLESDKSGDKLLTQHQAVVSLINKKLPQGGKVLEIGCGYGYLLSLFDKSQWNVIGIEPFQKACEFARDHLNLKVLNSYLDYSTFIETQSFDVIMLFDVFEHLKKPNDMLDLINHYLKPGGFLIIGTGDIGSLNARMSGKRWMYPTLREHLSFFSESSIKYFLKDFKEVDFHTVSYSGNWISNLMTLAENHLVRRAYNLVQSVHYRFTKFKLTRFPYVRYNLAFDHMLVIAKK